MKTHSNTRVHVHHIDGRGDCYSTIGRVRNLLLSLEYSPEEVEDCIKELSITGETSNDYAVYTLTEK